MKIILKLNRCSIEWDDAGAEETASIKWNDQCNKLLVVTSTLATNLMEMDAQDKRETD